MRYNDYCPEVYRGRLRISSRVSDRLDRSRSDLHVGEAPFLHEAQRHDVRGHQAHAGIQPGDQIRAHRPRGPGVVVIERRPEQASVAAAFRWA